jgi:hypothetical protein
MRGKDWKKFCALPAITFSRLTAILEHFCDHGEADIPRATFSWFTRTAADPPGTLHGAFEARGVVLNGRRAPHVSGHCFYVTEISVDPTSAETSASKRVRIDRRQGRLPLYDEPKGEL